MSLVTRISHVITTSSRGCPVRALLQSMTTGPVGLNRTFSGWRSPWTTLSPAIDPAGSATAARRRCRSANMRA
jgi:hypothetical protein